MPGFGSLPIQFGAKSYVINLNQNAGTYDVVQGMGPGEVLITQVVLYCTVTGADFTSVSFQTNDATPQVILSAQDGAVANIVGGKVIKNLTTPFLIQNGSKIQCTIAGNGTAGQLKLVLNMAFSGAGVN